MYRNISFHIHTNTFKHVHEIHQQNKSMKSRTGFNIEEEAAENI